MMYFEQFLRADLGCASYLIGSRETGEAVVVDPQWDITGYLATARREGLRIICIIETHTHADHVSGHGKLAAQTGAAIFMHELARPDYAHRSLQDGEIIRLGEVEIRVLHTPGHRPEHISLVVTDRAQGETPALVLSGDALFIGTVGRPDLAVEPRVGAQDLYHSLHDKLLRLPDAVALYPAHVAGSLCGRGMRPDHVSTIGAERRADAALFAEDEAAFVADVISNLPPQPPQFQQIVARNQGPLLTADPVAPALDPGEVARYLLAGAQVLDVRSPAAFGAGHIPGAINVWLAGGAFPTRAAWVLDARRPYILVAEGDADASAALTGLLAVGLDRVAGTLAGGLAAWIAAGQPVAHLPQITADALHQALAQNGAAPLVLDVRDEEEWDAGHIAGALHIPFNQLLDHLADVPRGRLVATICAGGVRSSIAGSLLQRAGYPAVESVQDGIEAWIKAGLPTVPAGSPSAEEKNGSVV